MAGMRAIYQLTRLTSLRHLRQAPGRTLRAVAAVALGVGTLLSVVVVNRSVVSSFEDGLLAAAGRTDLRVHAGDTPFPEAVLDAVRGVDGIEAAVPVVESSAIVGEGAGEVLAVLGVDITEEGRVRRYAAAAQADEVIDDPLVFLSRPDSIVLTKPFAARHGLALDDAIVLGTPDGPKRFTVRGMLRPEGAAVAFGGDLAVMDYQAAQVAFAKERKLDAVDVVAADGVDPEVLRERLLRAVPGLLVERPAARAAEMAQATAAIRFLVTLLASLAVVVGMYLLYNAVSMTVAHRGREIALLRSLGVCRRETTRVLLCEAMVIGAAGGLLGLLLGSALAPALLQPFAGSVNAATFFRTGPVALARPGLMLAVTAMGLGVLTTLVAAWVPARQAARFQPAQAARRGAVVALRQQQLPRPGWGIAAVLAGAALTVVAMRVRTGTLGPVADVSCILGFTLLAPAAIGRVAPWLDRVLQRLGCLPRLASLNVSANVERSAMTASPLMVAVAFVVVVATALQSFSGSVLGWIAGFTHFDLQVASHSQDLSRGILMAPQITSAIGAVPGVARVQAFRLIHAPLGGRRIAVESLDHDPADPLRSGLVFRQGDPGTAYAALASGAGVVVSENFAEKFGVRPGSRVDLPTPAGPRTLPVEAVVRNYNSDQGSILMARRLFLELFRDDRISQVLVRVAPGSDPEEVRRAIVASDRGAHRLVVISNTELRREVTGILNAAFLPMSALFVLAALVGCLGIANSLYVAVTERSREIGVLRSLGCTRGGVVGLVLLEAGLLGVFGAGLGVVLGSVLSYAWIGVHVRHILGWTIDYHPAVAGSLVGAAIAVAVAPLAGWWPARSAAFASPVAALADE